MKDERDPFRLRWPEPWPEHRCGHCHRILPGVYDIMVDQYFCSPECRTKFNVAVKIAKSQETRRQQIAETLAEIIGASPEKMAVIGDLLWKYFDLPYHEVIEHEQDLEQ